MREDRPGFGRIPIYYALLSATWIVGSDWLINSIGLAQAMTWLGSTVKGLGFVVVTALLLHLLIQRAARLEHAQAERALALERQVVQAQKMETVGRLAAGVTHDLNNLLTVVLGRCEALEDRLPEGDAGRADVAAIEKAAERASALSRRLLSFSRPRAIHREPTDLGALLTEFEPLVRSLLDERIRLETRVPEVPCTTLADRTRLEQVLLNLASNARDAMPDGGHLLLECRRAGPDDPDAPAGPQLLLRARDTGHGMDRETLARIFDPFFTTRPPEKGTGLGLSVVEGIVQQFGGAIRVASEPGKGTDFRVFLPEVAEAAPPPEPPVPAAPTRAEARATIMLVEDDPDLRLLARRLLEKSGHRVLEAASGPEALRRAADPGVSIDLLLTDLSLPGGDGGSLARRLASERPGLKVLIMSGQAGSPDALPGPPLPAGTALLEKPFTGRQLLDQVQAALAGEA